MSLAPKMTTTTLAGWYGSDRMIAPAIGQELAGCAWVGIPFCGGMSAVPHIKSRSLLVSDIHRHIINAGRVVRDDRLRALLIAEMDSRLFHPDELAAAQTRCLARESAGGGEVLELFGGGAPARAPILRPPDVEWAADYLICVWMGHGGVAGQDREFTGGISLRWDAEGGDSNVRYRSFISSIDAFGQTFRRCNFATLDAFEFIATVIKRITAILNGKHPEAALRIGLYVDAPWPEDGECYTHSFSEEQQRELAARLRAIKSARVVVRFGDHPLIRELYPAEDWHWRFLAGGRNSANKKVAEVLIINGPSYAKE